MTIRASADGHFLTRPDGSPFFWLGDTAWQLFHRLDRDETEHYLAARAAKSFNVIQAVAPGKIYGDGPHVPNRYGDRPFVDGDPLRPNEKYFAHVDWVVERAAAHGILIALLPAWAREHVASTPGKRILTEANAEVYGQWIAERYRDAGVIWVLGGDCNPVWYADFRYEKRPDGTFDLVGDARPKDFRPVYDALAAGIRSVDPDAFLTYHPTAMAPPGVAPPRTSLYFSDRDWLDMNMLQSSHSDLDEVDEDGGALFESGIPRYHWSANYNYLPIRAEYDSRPTRPIVDGEPRYEDHPSGRGLWRAGDVRNAAYHALFAGAAGHTYGHVSVWDFHIAADGAEVYSSTFEGRPDWTSALDAPGAGQMRHAKALLLSRPYFGRVPDDTIVSSPPAAGRHHVSAARDAAGAYAMIYLPDGGSVTVDSSVISGDEVMVWWFDPRTGEAQGAGTSLADRAREFVAPTNGEDWVLVLDAADREVAPPGTTRRETEG